MRRLITLGTLACALLQAGPAGAQSRNFCSGLLGAVNRVIECPEGMEEIGGAAIGLICVGEAEPRPGAAAKPTPEQLEAQIQACLPSGWSVSDLRTAAIGGRPARFHEYLRRSDGLRMRVGELIILRDPARGRSAPVELRQAFIAIPPK